MATATSRKRFTKCVQCETTSILPEMRLKTTAHGQLTIFVIVPFADMDFRQSIALLIAPDTDAQRLEEFFARFS